MTESRSRKKKVSDEGGGIPRRDIGRIWTPDRDAWEIIGITAHQASQRSLRSGAVWPFSVRRLLEEILLKL